MHDAAERAAGRVVDEPRLAIVSRDAARVDVHAQHGEVDARVAGERVEVERAGRPRQVESLLIASKMPLGPTSIVAPGGVRRGMAAARAAPVTGWSPSAYSAYART